MAAAAAALEVVAAVAVAVLQVAASEQGSSTGARGGCTPVFGRAVAQTPSLPSMCMLFVGWAAMYPCRGSEVPVLTFKGPV